MFICQRIRTCPEVLQTLKANLEDHQPVGLRKEFQDVINKSADLVPEEFKETTLSLFFEETLLHFIISSEEILYFIALKVMKEREIVDKIDEDNTKREEELNTISKHIVRHIKYASNDIKEMSKPSKRFLREFDPEIKQVYKKDIASLGLKYVKKYEELFLCDYKEFEKISGNFEQAWNELNEELNEFKKVNITDYSIDEDLLQVTESFIASDSTHYDPNIAIDEYVENDDEKFEGDTSDEDENDAGVKDKSDAGDEENSDTDDESQSDTSDE